MRPEWLPEEISLNGSIHEVYETLYEIYQNEIIREEIKVEGVVVTHNHLIDPTNPPYTYGFTHLVTREVSNRYGKFRAYDPERAKRLSWAAPLLRNYKDPNVSCFWFVTPRGVVLEDSLAIWLEDLDYILILRWVSITHAEKILVTAHHVDNGNRHYWQNKRRRPTSRILSF